MVLLPLPGSGPARSPGDEGALMEPRPVRYCAYKVLIVVVLNTGEVLLWWKSTASVFPFASHLLITNFTTGRLVTDRHLIRIGIYIYKYIYICVLFYNKKEAVLHPSTNSGCSAHQQ